MTKPTENELFEKYMSDRGYAVSYIGDGQYQFSSTKLNWEIWQARAELADKEKAELQAQINELREFLRWECDTMLNGQNPEWSKKYQALLSQTTAQSLQEREAKEKWEASLVAECTDPNQ